VKSDDWGFRESRPSIIRSIVFAISLCSPCIHPRYKVVVCSADEDADPKDQFGAIDHHPEDIQLGLKNNRYQREDVTKSIDAHEDERDTSNCAVEIDVHVVSQNTSSEQSG
jgi:hypothetical protein